MFSFSFQNFFSTFLLIATLPCLFTAYTLVETNAHRISPEIANELKDFLHLIPEATIDEIVAEHYIIDSNFREALKYLRSSKFTQLLKQIQQIPEIIAILDFLHLNEQQQPQQAQQRLDQEQEQHFALHERHVHEHGQTTCELPSPLYALGGEGGIAALPSLPSQPQPQKPQLEIVLLTNTVADADGRRADLRTFTSFVSELMGHLPRDRYVQLINEKRQKSAAFAQFYAALQSAQLRPMVDAAMKSKNVADVIKTLSSYDVDVKGLEPIVFKVISWGPKV